MRGMAEVRAGATLLYDSDPDAEEAETELKASAMIDAVTRSVSQGEDDGTAAIAVAPPQVRGRQGGVDAPTVLLIDHQDSFVHTLGNFCGCVASRVCVCAAPFSYS